MKLQVQDPATAGLMHDVKGDSDGVFADQPVKTVEVAAVTDTAIYAAGDVLTDIMTLTDALRAAGRGARLRSITMIDLDDQAAYAFDIYFLKANTTLGAKNGAPTIDDTNVQNILGFISFATTDAKDMGGAKVYSKSGLDLTLMATSGKDVFAQAVAGAAATPTHTAAGLKFKFGIEQH